VYELAQAPALALALNCSVIDSAIFFQVPGLGGQVSGTGVQVLVQVRENPESGPGAEGLNLGPDGRDLRPENELALAPALALALNYSVIDSAIFFQVPGLGGQVSGTGVQVLVQVRENPVPGPGAEGLNLGPDGRDLRPENELAQALALALALNCSVIDSVLYHVGTKKGGSRRPFVSVVERSSTR
jgi:hypothetical protein